MQAEHVGSTVLAERWNAKRSPHVRPASIDPSGATVAPTTSGAWQDLAACADADPDLFFAADEAAQNEALTWCARCPVRESCLESALRRGERFGIWGGLREAERAGLLRRRRVA